MKKWYKSKTIWTNAIAAVALFTSHEFEYNLSPEFQAVILAVINIGLRIITKESIK